MKDWLKVFSAMLLANAICFAGLGLYLHGEVSDFKDTISKASATVAMSIDNFKIFGKKN